MPNSIVLIAHDSKKNDIVTLAQRYHSLLSRYLLIATRNTGQWLQDATDLTIEVLASEADGGLLQVAARIVSGDVAGVIFLMDAVNAQSHMTDAQALLRVCNRYEVPLATNVATAELAMQGVAKRRNAYLIFNPVAGQGNPNRDLALIQQILEPQMNLHIILTQPDLDPVEQAKEAIATIQATHSEEDTGCIIASGGDGTVSAIAGATLETGIPIGVIPRGTANAFAVALGLPTDLKRACETIAAHDLEG